MTSYGSDPRVSVNGSELQAELMARLASVVVDLADDLPGTAQLRLRDPDLDLVAKAGLKIGADVGVSVVAVGTETLRSLFTGVVTSLEFEYDALGAHVVVGCSDPLHVLTRGRRSRTWQNASEANVVKEVLSKVGLKPGTVQGSEQHVHVAQMGVSDWDFLLARARAAGRTITLNAGKVDVRIPDVSKTPVALTVGEGVERLRVRLSSAGQVAKVQARGWDPATQKALVGQATPQGATATAGITAASLKGAFPGEPLLQVAGTPADQAGATVAAEGAAERLSDAHAELEAWAGGDPALVPSARVKLAGAGPSFDGTYRLSRTRHQVDEYGYRVHLECSPAAERTLLGLTGGGGSPGVSTSGSPVLPGVVPAVVTDCRDPDKAGRVKVKYPWLADDAGSDWLRVAVPGAGPDRGAAFLPEVTDEVLVAFEHGDSRRAYVLGGLYSAKKAAPHGRELVDGSGKVVQRVLSSRDKHTLVLQDGPGGGVKVATGDGKLTVALETSGTTLTIDSKGKVEITGTQDVTVKSSTKLTLQGGTELAIKAPRVTVDGQAMVAVTGGIIKLN